MRSAGWHASTKLLRKKLQEGVIGRVTASAGPVEVRAWVMRGHLVACSGTNDTARLLRGLTRNGWVSSSKVEELTRRMRSHLSILPLLVDDVENEALSDALLEQFRENLRIFVSLQDVSPLFEVMPTALAHNIQVGLDSEAELVAAVKAYDAKGETELDLAPIDLDGELQFGVQDVEPPMPTDLFVEDDEQEEVTDVYSLDSFPDIPDYGDEDTSDGPTDVGRKSPWTGVEAQSLDAGDMEAFADSDFDRGGSGQGQFSTESHHLDRIVAILPEDDPDENDQITTMRFAVPPPDDLRALAKISVASDVLVAIYNAFRAKGDDAMPHLQPLIDRCPPKYVHLFASAKVNRDGSLPDEVVLANLNRRPESERKRLLSRGLMHITDRALSIAADELDDDAIDGVLEQVVGYRDHLRK